MLSPAQGSTTNTTPMAGKTKAMFKDENALVAMIADEVCLLRIFSVVLVSFLVPTLLRGVM